MSGDLTCPAGHAWSADGARQCPYCGSAPVARPGDPPLVPPSTASALLAATVRLRGRATIAPAAAVLSPFKLTPNPADPPPVPPAFPTVEGFEILGELGRGGMGVVYKARQVGLNRLVALKMIGAGALADAELLARFRSEAEAIARLQQPNIVQVYEIGASPAGPYFAMEFAEAGSLAERWAGAPQPPRAAAHMVATLARAMHAAHEQGIIHRDLKPANILLSVVRGSSSEGKDGNRDTKGHPSRNAERGLVPKISDFGLARRLDDKGGVVTLTGQVMGTPGYMAPEQARGGAEVSAAVDIYALGVLLYEGLTGGPPYRGGSALESVHLMLLQEPLPPSRLRPQLPRDLETICLHCLHKEPHKRYATAAALAEDLEHFLVGRPILARPTPTWERVWKWAQRHPATAALAALLAVAIVVGFALVTWQWRRAEDEQARTDVARHEALGLARAEARSRRESQLLSARLLLEQGVSQCEAGEVGPGLLWLARAIETAPDHAEDLRQSARLLLGAWGRQLRLPDVVFTHAAEVEYVAWGRAGQLIAAAAGDKVSIWDVGARRRVCGPLAHGDAVTAVAFSPDGALVLTASKDRTARLWEAATGQPRGEPLRHAAALGTAIFSPDGATVLTASEDGTARLWDAATSRPRGAPLAHGKSVLAAAFSPDGKTVATGADDHSARLWVVATGLPKGAPLLHEGPIQALAFSLDSQWLATGSHDKSARLWDAATGRLLHRLSEHAGAVTAVAFSPDGRSLATASSDHGVLLWDTKAGSSRARLIHRHGIVAVTFSPDGRTVATAAGDHTARLWSADTGRPLGAPLPHQGDVNALAFSPDGATLLTGGDDGTARLWPTALPGDEGLVLRHGTALVTLAVSPDGQTVLSCGGDGVVRLWDAKTGKHRTINTGISPSAAAFSPDGKTILTAGWDKAVRFWDATTGGAVRTPLMHPAPVLAAAYSPDGRRVVTGCDDGDANVRIWDVERATVRHVLQGHSRKVAAVAFSPRGTTVASGSWDRTGRLWDVETGVLVGEPLRHQDLVQTVLFSPNGRFVLTGGDDYATRLWEATDGKPVGAPLLQQEKIEGVAFSPDGRMLLTVGSGGTARLWELATGKSLGPPMACTGGWHAVAFSPDGAIYWTASRDGVVRRWQAPVPIQGDFTAVRLWLHTLTGWQLDDAGAIVPLEDKAWQQAFRQLRGDDAIE